MSDPSTSLDRLHDLVAPPAISWWPLAPGWCVLGIVGFTFLLFAAFRGWKNWKRDAYRREALKKLNEVSDAMEIAEILRRTALAVAPRHLVSATTGDDWADWLDSYVPDPMTGEVRSLLSRGIYDQTVATAPSDNLKSYAESWVRHHPSEIEFFNPST